MTSIPDNRRFELQLLGPLAIRRGNDSIARVKLEKARALLGYLAAECSRAHTRDHLATLFFPDHDRDDALLNLRQVIYRLRSELDMHGVPALLRIERRSVAFSVVADCSVDVHQFTTHVRGGQLSDAVALYRGDLLEDLSAPGEQFSEWLESYRQRLRDIYLDSLHRLAVEALAAGRLERARGYAQQYLQTEPWHEPSHRLLMRVHALTGQRSAAMHQFQACREVLERELGIDPEPSTVALYEVVQEGLTASDCKKNLRDQPFSLGSLQRQKLVHLFRLNDRDGDGLIGFEDYEAHAERFRRNRRLAANSPESSQVEGNVSEWWQQMLPWRSRDEEPLLDLDDWLGFWAGWHAAIADETIRGRNTLLESLKGSGRLFFNLLDRDGDERITDEDFGIWLTSRNPGADVKEIFGYLDHHKRGHLTKEDVIRLLKEFFLSNDPEAPGNYFFGRYFYPPSAG